MFQIDKIFRNMFWDAVKNLTPQTAVVKIAGGSGAGFIIGGGE